MTVSTMFGRFGQMAIFAVSFAMAGPVMAQQPGQCATPPCTVAPVAPASSPAPTPTPTPDVVRLTVRNVGPDGTSATVAVPGAPKPVLVKVVGATGPTEILKAQPGDDFTAAFDTAAKPPSLSGITSIVHPVSKRERVGFGFLATGIVFGLAALATKGKAGAFIIGVDNRYSKSQFQLAIWFGAVGVTYLTAVMLRIYELGYAYAGDVAMPENLLVLSGFSALSFGGAKMLAVQTQAVQAKVPGTPNLLRDLTSDDSGVPDLGDFQMVLITLIAVVLFLVSNFHDFARLAVSNAASLKDVDTTLLSIFGLGQGAYLAKKAVPSVTGVPAAVNTIAAAAVFPAVAAAPVVVPQ